MNTIPVRLQTILDEFAELPDRESRMDLLIEMAEGFVEVPAAVACRPFDESHRVPGCESQVFAWAERNVDGSPQFYFAVENPQGISAKAFAVILDRALSGASLDEISATPDSLPYTIFGNHLTMGRGQGLSNMLRMVKKLAGA